jgi:hypothetical protein
VGRADVDDMRITPDTMVQMIEVDGFLAFGEQRVQLLHSNCVVLGIVEREVTDLKKSLENEQVIVRRTYLERDIGPIK